MMTGHCTQEDEAMSEDRLTPKEAARVGAALKLGAEQEKNTPILMGPTNVNGWKLEELLSKLQDEVWHKSLKIARDPRLIAKTVYNNNQQIIGLMRQAEALQRQSYALLDDTSPNEGPLGTPRIGEGS